MSIPSPASNYIIAGRVSSSIGWFVVLRLLGLLRRRRWTHCAHIDIYTSLDPICMYVHICRFPPRCAAPSWHTLFKKRRRDMWWKRDRTQRFFPACRLYHFFLRPLSEFDSISHLWLKFCLRRIFYSRGWQCWPVGSRMYLRQTDKWTNGRANQRTTSIFKKMFYLSRTGAGEGNEKFRE